MANGAVALARVPQFLHVRQRTFPQELAATGAHQARLAGRVLGSDAHDEKQTPARAGA
jgi:hypothetical protein